MEKIDTRPNAVIVTQRTTNWNAVDWRRARKVARNLSRRIFQATREDNQKKEKRKTQTALDPLHHRQMPTGDSQTSTRTTLGSKI